MQVEDAAGDVRHLLGEARRCARRARPRRARGASPTACGWSSPARASSSRRTRRPPRRRSRRLRPVRLLLEPGRSSLPGMTKQRMSVPSSRSSASASQRRKVCTMTASNHSSRSSSGRPAIRATSSAVVRYGYMPLPRMRRSSASSCVGLGALVAAEEAEANTPPDPRRAGSPSSPVTSPPITSTRAL